MKKTITLLTVLAFSSIISAQAASTKIASSTKKTATGSKEVKRTNESKEEQLKRLVSEGKITQAQADTIVSMDKKKHVASSTVAHMENHASSTKKTGKKVTIAKTAKKIKAEASTGASSQN